MSLFLAHTAAHFREEHCLMLLDGVVNQLCTGLHNLHHQPELLRSMTCFDWFNTLPLALN